MANDEFQKSFYARDINDARKYLEDQEKEMRDRRRRRTTIVGIFTIISFSATAFKAYETLRDAESTETNEQLSQQISKVDDAITDIRDLEEFLENTKEELIVTQREANIIQEEYEQAQELERLTEKQVLAISTAVNQRSTRDIVKDYVIGFILGISSSILASYIFQFLTSKQVKSLQTSEPKE